LSLLAEWVGGSRRLDPPYGYGYGYGYYGYGYGYYGYGYGYGSTAQTEDNGRKEARKGAKDQSARDWRSGKPEIVCKGKMLLILWLLCLLVALRFSV
jgi:hypothetical protein